jgi:hypothetical protein
VTSLTAEPEFSSSPARKHRVMHDTGLTSTIVSLQGPDCMNRHANCPAGTR